MTIHEYRDTLKAETIQRIEEYQASHDGKELTVDDKLYCFTEASKIPELREVRKAMPNAKKWNADGRVARELGIVTD